MQDNINEWQAQQENTPEGAEQEYPLVPPSLLSNILHHLELSPDQTPSESSLNNVLLQLHSTIWQDRTLALHALAKLDYPISIDLLAPLLHDRDATVRAFTVHTLGMMNKRVPLHWLIEAFHDPDWHVREVAIFALAKQGARVPGEIFMAALHDKDGSVREAASFVLQQNRNSSALYGQLREEAPMQNELYDPTRLNGKSNQPHTPENTPPAEWSGAFMEYSGTSAPTHRVSEQIQTYAAGHYTPHNTTSHEGMNQEYAEAIPSRHEKVTSYRLHRKSHKSWWAITIVIVAFLFLGLGRLSTIMVPQNIDTSPKVVKNVVVPVPISFPTGSDYAIQMQQTLSRTLHLTQQQLLAKWKERGDLNSIAVDQGVSTSDLENAEIKAFHTILNSAVSKGQISPVDADQWMNQLQKNSNLREKIAMTLLTSAPTQ